MGDQVPVNLFGADMDPASLPYISAGVFTRLGGALNQAGSQMTEGMYTARQAKTNARLAGLQARGVLASADFEADQAQKQGRALAGETVARSGSQGVTAGSMAPEAEADELGAASDAAMARLNGYNKAFGIEMEGLGEKYKGEQTELATRTGVGNTLATGGLQAVEGGLSDYLDFQRMQRMGFMYGQRVG